MNRLSLMLLLAALAVVWTVPGACLTGQGTAPPRTLEERVAELEKRLDEQHKTDFRVYWKEGFRFDTGDKAFKLKFGGRIMNDWAFFSNDTDIVKAAGALHDGTEFRRARLYVAGTVYDRVQFKAQYDFAGGDADFKDVYLGLVKLPVVGGVKVGHFKEPFSLEELTSSKYITFLERSLPITFAPSRNTGLAIYNEELDGRLTWAAGIFREAGPYGNGQDAKGGNEYAVTGRVTALPVLEDGGKTLVHVGVAASHRNPVDDMVHFRERPEAHLAPRFVDTKSFPAELVSLYGAEAAVVLGPLSVQSEYMRADVDVRSLPNPSYTGFYVYGSYFLTGEHRKYKASAGAFSRVKPKENFLDEGGLGAWEVGFRYSRLDLDETGLTPIGGQRGGLLNDYTAGLNWYLNPNTRVMWNYIWADLNDAGTVGLFEMRFQVDF